MLNQLKKELVPLHEKLYSHPIYKSVNNREKLITFMNYHAYSVWDFMSLVKFLQNHFAPSQVPWRPMEHKDIVYFINDIVLEEESDKTDDGKTMSHFEMYCLAMAEVGANADRPFSFAKSLNHQSLEKAFTQFEINPFIKKGNEKTFSFLDSNKPHIAAAAFCFGRENIIPNMFSELLSQMNITKEDAPLFHYYLSRHIHLDSEVHGPMAIKMVEILCDSDPIKWKEATQAAKEAIEARIQLWDFILDKLEE